MNDSKEKGKSASGILRFLKFGLVGLLGVAVNMGLYLLLNDLLAVPDLPSKVLAIEVSVLHNFAWNYAWTWSDRGHSGSLLWRRLVKYHGSTFVASFVITIGISYLARFFMVHVPYLELLNTLGLADTALAQAGHDWWTEKSSYLIGIAAGMIANFLLSDRWVFQR